MSPSAASEKVNIDPETGKKYYQQCLEDHAIPSHIARYQICTQDQVKKLIGLIVDDKMTISGASKIVNISQATASKYFNEYIKTNAIPTHIVYRPPSTQKQATDVIHYIVKDKMALLDASKKANMSVTTGKRYYRRYISDPKNEIPTHLQHHPPCTQEQITNLVRYIVDDKMSVKKAAKKAKMCEATGRKYYNRLVRDRQ
jgi:transposase